MSDRCPTVEGGGHVHEASLMCVCFSYLEDRQGCRYYASVAGSAVLLLSSYSQNRLMPYVQEFDSKVASIACVDKNMTTDALVYI